jgi:hypothetical protein
MLKRFTLFLFIGMLSLAPVFGADNSAERTSEHFLFLYDPTHMTPAQVDEAGRQAEAALKDVAPLFPNVHYTDRITMRLDAEFRGATGYAAPGGKSGKSDKDYIGLRYEELPMLGLTPGFLFRHELTHLFAGRWDTGKPSQNLAGGALGEGIADMVANGRNQLGLPLSFAKYLEDQGIWTAPEDLFLDNPRLGLPRARNRRLDYRDVLKWRIQWYVEPSLFLEYLKSRIGWDKVRDFYIDYSHASETRNPYGVSDAIRVVFRQRTGKLPEEFFKEWQRAIRQAPDETAANRLRWLSERAYSLVQWYEFLVAGKAIPNPETTGIEADLKSLHQLVDSKHLDEAEKKLNAVMHRIEDAAGGHGRGWYVSSGHDSDKLIVDNLRFLEGCQAPISSKFRPILGLFLTVSIQQTALDRRN